MSTGTNRLLLEFEQQMRVINRDILNEAIPTLSVDMLNPVIQMAAEARAAYLCEIFSISADSNGKVPKQEDIKKLRQKREHYDELVAGAQALEAAIQRGYLDIH